MHATRFVRCKNTPSFPRVFLFSRTVSRILCEAPRVKSRGFDDNHLSRICITAHLERLFPRSTLFAKHCLGTRSCTEVRILPLHPHVAMKFIPRFTPRQTCVCSGLTREPPPFGSGVSVRTSGYYPGRRYLLPVCIMKAIAHSHNASVRTFLI